MDFEDREALGGSALRAGGGQERPPYTVNILVPQRGDKRSLLDLAGNNAKQSYDQRFRVMKPTRKPFRKRCRTPSVCPSCRKRIECFDISHIQGAETVASMVVWEDGR